MAAYCGRERERLPDAGWKHEERDSETRRILEYLVTVTDGPDRFSAANLQRKTVLDDLETARDGEGSCGEAR